LKSDAPAALPAVQRAELMGDIISPVTGGRVPRHVAIIMDGNGRWATQRGLPRNAGHRAGTENIRRVLERCGDHGVEQVTLFAFSTENWTRPPREVRFIIRLLGMYLKRELHNLHRNGVRIRHWGHLEVLPDYLQSQVRDAIRLTHENDRINLNLCFNYGGRDDIVTAVRRLVSDGVRAEDVTEELLGRYLFTGDSPDPDLVIRTGDATRISNFLIWQSAYSELYFTDTFWPDFGREDIDIALAEYGRRKRKFGGLLPEDLAALRPS
jgi:undecaprenyl diphosphate synthase